MTWDKSRRSPRNLTLPPDWAARRRRALDRDRWTCRIRGPHCTTSATTVDHVVPVEQDGGHEDSNLQAACTGCHQAKSSAEAAAARWRIRERRPPEQHPGMIQ